MANNKNTFFKSLLLELVCYVPLVIIAGNVLPPIGFLKIHWIYIGILFLLALLLLVVNSRARSLLAIILFFMVAQIITSIKFSISDFIDFISGPVVFIAVVNILIDDSISLQNLVATRRKMLLFFAVPITIALLQYLNIFPLEFMNAKYVNATIYGTETLERINGFLYHGIELATIMFFFFVSITILSSGLMPYLWTSLMLLFEYITLIKTGIIAALLYTVYFGWAIDKRLRVMKTAAIVTAALIFGISFVYVLVPDLEERKFVFDAREFKFEDQLFTGRGFIWNTYIRGIKHFDVANVIFGGGYGSYKVIFKQNVIGTAEQIDWAPGPHNQLLELFVSGGIFAIWLTFIVVYRQYQKLKAFFYNQQELFSKYYMAIVLFPILTMGITAPIMSMFVFWTGLSLSMISLKIKFSPQLTQ